MGTRREVDQGRRDEIRRLLVDMGPHWGQVKHLVGRNTCLISGSREYHIHSFPFVVRLYQFNSRIATR
ncbi:hypothetical protein BGY98DRAFT_1068851, partial [Russula aff. rugulosa BPL654]